MHCYACENEATEQCPRCANPFCADHGTGLCARCEDPAHTTPSTTVFRFALLGLVFASVLALWLIVRPPDLPDGSSSVVQPLPTQQPTPEPTATETETPPPSAEVTATAAPTDTPTPTPEPTAAPPEPLEYVVEEGDSWFGIGDIFGVDAEELAALNDRTIEDFLSIGETLLIPQ